jgi:hypothetical protein
VPALRVVATDLFTGRNWLLSLVTESGFSRIQSGSGSNPDPDPDSISPS